MGWLIFFVAAWAAAITFVPLHQWKRLYIAGIIGLLIIIPIDGTLVSLGAFRFNFIGPGILGLPLLYWISNFPGGILFAHFYLTGHRAKLLYIIVAAVSYALIEFITIEAGLFTHLKWNLLNSVILNVISFTTHIWFVEWFFSCFHRGFRSHL